MGTDRPKLMMRVELIRETDVQFTLLTTMKPKSGTGNFHFTKNNWTIYFGKNFSVNRRDIMSLPETISRQQTKVIFNNDKERRDFLNGLALALEEWSGSHLFRGINKKTDIKFHKSLWIVF